MIYLKVSPMCLLLQNFRCLRSFIILLFVITKKKKKKSLKVFCIRFHFCFFPIQKAQEDTLFSKPYKHFFCLFLSLFKILLWNSVLQLILFIKNLHHRPLMNRRRALPSVSDFAEMLNKTIKKNARIPVYSGQFIASTVN